MPVCMITFLTRFACGALHSLAWALSFKCICFPDPECCSTDTLLCTGPSFTARNSTDFYKLVYAITEASINMNGSLRGVGFSLWDAVETSPDPATSGWDRTSVVGMHLSACAY